MTLPGRETRGEYSGEHPGEFDFQKRLKPNGTPERDSSALARAPQGACRRDPSALPIGKAPWRRRPRGLQAISLGTAERNGAPERDESTLARAPQGAYRRDPSALPCEKGFQTEIPRPWRGRPRGPTGEIPRPCRAKRCPGEDAPGRLQARSLGPAERKEIPEHDSLTLARATQGGYRRDPSALPSEKQFQSKIPQPWRG